MLSPSDDQPGNQLQKWIHARARLMPDLLVKAPAWVRARFDHAWAPMQTLSRQLGSLPSELWPFLLNQHGGFAVITTEESRYVPGPATIRQRAVQNVAYISVEDLARQNERLLHVLGHLIDHHLGCGGELDRRWLSAPGGFTDRWQEAGARLEKLFSLGYGVDEVAQASIRDYFAQSLALYCTDRQRLNAADPQIDKWFRSTLWNKTFWQTPKSRGES